MIKVKQKRCHTNRRGKQCDCAGDVWCDIATCQGLPAVPEVGRGKEQVLS